MAALCRAVFWVYVALCVGALALVPMSDAGLFGLQPDPLSGVFAVLLAQPWLSLLDGLTGGGSVIAGLVLTAACMAVNAALLAIVCRWLRRLSS